MLLQIRNALMVFVVMTVLTGLIYPAVVTGVGSLLFANAVSGSVLTREGQPVGSSLLGQTFSHPKYFWSRPSATSPQPYSGAASSGSNQAPTNPAFLKAVKSRVEALRTADPGNAAPIPVDLITASGSGLDPHISPAAAEYQVSRVARVRGLPVERVRSLVASHTEGRTFGFLGEPRVNVLELNLALEEGGR